MRNVHGGARHGVCYSGTDWFSVAGGASVTSRRRRCAAGVGSGGQRVAGAVDGNARRPRVRACSRCLVARARARTRRCARLAKALAFRMDGVRGRRTSGERVVWSRRRALGFDRAAHARVRVSFGSVPAHRGGDGEASPGAWFRCERRASRVVRKHTGEGATVADVPRPPVVFAVRVIEDYELCSCVEPFGSFTAKRVFFGLEFSRDLLGRSRVTIGQTRKRSREMIGNTRKNRKPKNGFSRNLS